MSISAVGVPMKQSVKTGSWAGSGVRPTAESCGHTVPESSMDGMCKACCVHKLLWSI